MKLSSFNLQAHPWLGAALLLALMTAAWLAVLTDANRTAEAYHPGTPLNPETATLTSTNAVETNLVGVVINREGSTTLWAYVNGYDTTTTTNDVFFCRIGTFRWDGTNTLAASQTTLNFVTRQSAGATGWTCTMQVSNATKTVWVRVLGAANRSIYWRAQYFTTSSP